ncbi:integrator complex subunit 2-like isoform X2 [Oscarella lobularis]|uniref:integrator complex subunit 2-like isoform X2 n=1 Tax=Oscarella lobularis TaxID=121494 RepID=UPI003313E726
MNSDSLDPVDSRLFRLLRDGAISDFARVALSDENGMRRVRPFLPCLVRMALCQTPGSGDGDGDDEDDESAAWHSSQKEILCILSGIEIVNSIVGFLQVDFPQLNVDIRKSRDEQKKSLSFVPSRGGGGGGGAVDGGGVFVESKSSKLALDFENAEAEAGDLSAQNKMRLVLSELARASLQTFPSSFCPYSCELFENEAFLNQVADIICLAAAELPNLFDLETLIRALLRAKAGPSLISYLVGNQPEKFNQVATILLSSADAALDEFSAEGQARIKSLRLLGNLCPAGCLSIRERALSLLTLPSLVVFLTIDYYNVNRNDDNSSSFDVILFFCALLFDSDSSTKDWFVAYIQSSRRRVKKQKQESHVFSDATTTSFETLLQFLDDVVKTWLLLEAEKRVYANVDLYRACALVRLFCALVGMTGYHLGTESADNLTRMFAWCPPPAEVESPVAVRFVESSICLLMVCPLLASDSNRNARIVNWLQRLAKKQSDLHRQNCDVELSYTKLLTLIGIHFHNGQFESIAQLVESVLNMKGHVRTGGLIGLKIMFVQDVLPNEVLSSQVVTMPVTPNLNADVTGVLPAHCYHLLLTSSAFAGVKHTLPIKDWILGQIRTCCRPIHPIMPQLVNEFVELVKTSAASSKPTWGGGGFSRQEIASFFDSGRLPADVTPHLLILQYVLSLESGDVFTKTSLDPSLLVNVIPVKRLLLISRRHVGHYEELYPRLVSMVRTHLPHLCLVNDWLAVEECGFMSALQRRRKSPWINTNNNKECTMEVIVSGNDVEKNLRHFSRLSPLQLIPHVESIVSSFSKLLDPGTPRHLQNLANHLWFALNTLIPRRLWLHTVAAFQPLPLSSSLAALSPPDKYLTIDPLIVLKCDERIFRCPPLFEIFLHILRGYLDASESYFSSLSNQKDIMAKGELIESLIQTQKSAVAQLLLEICLPLPNEHQDISTLQLSDLREIQCLIGGFLHRSFIADAKLAKLVQFQGYPTELLPAVICGIPSMHICLDFLPELLSQNQLEKKLFAIHLASQLCVYYPLPKSLSVAQQCISHMSSLAHVLTTDQLFDFFQSVVPALIHMHRAFPSLNCDVVGLLLRVANSTLAVSVASAAATGGVARRRAKYRREERRLKSAEKESVQITMRMIQSVLAEMTNVS